MSLSTTAIDDGTASAAHRLARAIRREMARSGDRRQSRPSRAASATAAVRELRPSLWRMFATWRCTVWGLKTSCSAISWSLNPFATKRQHLALPAGEQRRRRLPGRACRSLGCKRRTQRARHRVTNRRPTGKCALPSSGISVAAGIAAASSRPSW